jgi:hypothetical protein
MIMFDQSRRLSEPLRWTRAGRLAVAAFIACLALGMLGVGVYALVGTHGSRTSRGCVDVTVASTLGGADLHACGARARGMCASPSGGLALSGTLKAQCLRAGYPFGGRN